MSKTPAPPEAQTPATPHQTDLHAVPTRRKLHEGRPDNDDCLPMTQTTMVRLELIDQGAQLIRDEPVDDALRELAMDIARRGLLQAIGVRAKPDGRYQLLFGDRRRRAHIWLHRTHIEAKIYPDTGESITSIALAENIFQKPMTLSEECNAIRRMHVEEHISIDVLCDLMSKSRQWILRRLAVHSLPDDLRIPLLEGQIGLAGAEALASVADAGLRRFLLSQAISTKATVSQIRGMVEACAASGNLGEAIQAGIDATHAPQPTETLYVGCSSCQRPTPIPELTTLRVCRACMDAPLDHE
jgi:ParB/RepB/Spo0J family partition protein